MRFFSRIASLFEGVVIAIDSIRQNRVRAALTILGIAIGVFVVVVMSAAIHGINSSIATMFQSLGPTTFFVGRFPIELGPCDGSDETCPWRNNPPIRPNEIAALRRLTSLDEVVERTGTSARVKYFNRELPGASIEVYSPNWLVIGGGDITAGRSWTPTEDANGSPVIVINEKMAERLFAESDPLNKEINVDGTPFRVIGVYHEAAAFLGEGDRPQGYVPMGTGLRYLRVWTEWIELAVRPNGEIARDDAIDEVVAVMRGERGLRPSQGNNFAVITQEKLFETWNTMTGVFFLVMIVLSGVGLMVGGVGVVAIMMISVTERTREIGVRKALGATRALILWQFLIEAATLTAIGAAIGFTVGWLVALIVRSASPIPASVPPTAALIALVASTITGIMFGMLPASRAAKLDPITALRYE
ncbi:MAG TPA: ABC transporter permease [Gemmatimonadaceae bacterium]|jgi:putative ABC transport system permease protein|nr:ABC transporter permease [Gemmatimonadaceae bacterium]